MSVMTSNCMENKAGQEQLQGEPYLFSDGFADCARLSPYSTEAELVAALQKGDKHACAVLVERYSRTVYNVGLRILKDPRDAEEVLQETFIAACQKIQAFRQDAKLSTWLYRVATNASLMLLRKRKQTYSLDEPLATQDGDELPRQLVDWRFNPRDLLLDSEMREYLRVAVDKLPDKLRVVFVLRDIEGLSTQETADMLDISESAAKVRLHRARLQLREDLNLYFQQHETLLAPPAAGNSL